MKLSMKISYAARCMPALFWQTLTRRKNSGRAHIVFALADHFEPAVDPYVLRDGRVPYPEQERRLERWCREYPKLADRWRDHDGRPFAHTYFYPAEQYDQALVGRLAEHCAAGWGEIEIHLHHGTREPDTEENTRRQLIEFRDILATRHGCLSYDPKSTSPRYAFVHGNFALANSAGGRWCGVDSEMQVLAETGCFADMTLPAAPFHPAQTRKMNSLYEPRLPVARKGAQAVGRDLRRGVRPETLPLMIQGPLLFDFGRIGGRLGIENGSITASNPLSLRRLQLWKQASVQVKGRPDWIFIKLHCHSMDPRQESAVLGDDMRRFLQELVQGAESRNEVLHFVTAREMANIIFAACDGREGNPGLYRDYRLTRSSSTATQSDPKLSQEVVKG